jgi:hypothetical protein
MKKVIFSIGLLLSSSNLFSQSENTPAEKKTTYGFQFGTNVLQVINLNEIPDNYKITAGLGYKLGVQMERKLATSISIISKAELSFNTLNFRNTNDAKDYSLNQNTINVMFHSSKQFNKLKKQPYIYVGPNVILPLLDKPNLNNITSQKPSFAIDFGVGLNFKRTNFIFSPEIKYSFGYNNVRNIETYSKSTFHSLSIIFNFKG